MKLQLLNEGRDRPIRLNYSAIVASLFTDKPNMSFALEPKDKNEEDSIDDLEDNLENMTDVATYGRSANFSRLNTGGEDDVLGGK